MSAYVYVVSENIDGPIKVGYAQDILSRIRDLQVGNSKSIKFKIAIKCDSIEDAKELENKTHKALRFYWVRGEWFTHRAWGHLKIIIDDLAGKRKLIKSLEYFGITRDYSFPSMFAGKVRYIKPRDKLLSK